MRILLTGAPGFIGSAVARHAAGRGHEILALVRPGSPVQSDLPVHKLEGTLENTPWDEARRWKPEVCIHCAWITTPGAYLESSENRKFLAWSNQFLQNAFTAGIRYSIVLGTCIEYQITGERLNESSPLAPASLYAQCKNQLRVDLENNLPEMQLGWARIFYPYGVGEHPQRLCSSLIEKLSRNEAVVLKTPRSTKDYVNITDVASAIITVAEQQIAGPINIATGTGASILDIAQKIGAIMNRPELIQEASPTAPDPYPYVVADATRLYSLGWKPKINLQTGLETLVKNLT